MGQIFRRAEQYLDSITPGGQFVEIGSSRNGDDGSTKIIASWAARFDKGLWTVDIDPVNCNFVRELNIPYLEIVNQSGEQFLQEFPGHITYISFLYLDNFDWDWHPDASEDFVIEQQIRYRELGLEMNNVNCQAAHVAQAVLASKHMAPKSIVVLDDTFYDPKWAHFTGKGGAAVPYLLSQGFKVLDTEEYPVYGTILGRI